MPPKPRRSVAALSVGGHDAPKSSPAMSTRSKSTPDSDLRSHDGNPSPGSWSGRLTRSRAKQIGLVLPIQAVESPGISSKNKKKRKRREIEEETAKEQAQMEGHGTLASRPLPPIHPPTTPRVRKGSRIVRLEVDRLQKLTLRRDKKDDPSTAAALPTPSDKNMVLGMSHSIVRVSSPPSSEGKLISPRTGFIISWDGATKRAMIVTLSTYFKKKPHEPQPEVHLSDKSIVQGRLIFMNRQYNLSILEITSDLPLQVPAFGSAPKYGQKILALSRDENISLVARRGAITWSDGSFMWRNHYMFVDCDVPEEGLWLTAVGSSIAMVYRAGPGAVIISISIICTFFEMWKQFSCVARPVFDVDLRSVELAGVSLREELSVKHNINGGFMVKRIADDSALEHLGVRRGDVIFFEDECGTSLPEIEDYLLSLGWRYLQGMKSMVLKLLVHDIEGPCKETITLPLEFSVDSGKIEDYLLSLGWRYLQGMKSMVLKLLVHDIEGPCKETITLPLEFSVDSGKFGCFDEQTDSEKNARRRRRRLVRREADMPPKSSPAMSARSKSTPDSDLRSHDGIPNPGSWSGRLTRSRAKQIGLVLPIQAVESAGISSNKKKRRIEEETARESPATVVPTTTTTGGLIRSEPGTLARRPIHPPQPHSTAPRIGRESSWIAQRKVDRLRKATLRDAEDEPSTAAAMPTPSDKKMVLGMSRSIVRVSSPPTEGKSISPLTGIVISWDGATKRAMILTIYSTDFKSKPHEPQPELWVHLPGKSIVQGRLIFVNRHYGLAILEITSDLPLQVPTFGSAAKYGQEILALSRDENMSLVARRGTITWSDGSLMWRNHYMFLDCDVPEGGEGGPVVDSCGSTIAVVYRDGPCAAVISISIIHALYEMWEQFSCVARPVFDMDLKSVELASFSLREELSLKHNIEGGFIVEHIANDSALENLGVRRGDVIFFEDKCGTTLPEIEDYLLHLGWRYLGEKRSMVLKLEVHDIEGPCKETIILPLEFKVSSGKVA
uniref:PDZ domain-containing protein n=1 Tax=Oryza meridionalis TaxID=40149 RepID=A0A0E0DMC0_9ORYZ